MREILLSFLLLSSFTVVSAQEVADENPPTNIYFNSGKYHDDKGDSIVSKSSIKGWFLSELYSSNPDEIQLYSGINSKIYLLGSIFQYYKYGTGGYEIPYGIEIAEKSCLISDGLLQ